MADAKVRVGIVGATGYAGVELVRIVSANPGMSLERITSTREAGTRIDALYPGLIGTCDLTLVAPDADDLGESCDLVFLAVPHTASLAITPELVSRGVAVVDLSADFRLSDPEVYRRWYDTPHTAPELLSQAVYGIPELNRDQVADLGTRPRDLPRIVANPGCYPTAATFAVAPLLRRDGMVDLSCPVIVDAASGVSGAGRGATARTHFCSADESYQAYGVGRHRHLPEIVQNMTRLAQRQVSVVFTPHLAPMRRGILATVYVTLSHDLEAGELRAAFEQDYGRERFVHLLPEGVQPATGSVAGTENVQIGVARAHGTRVAVITCAIDNLVRGAAGQAVQNANLLCGLDEFSGLDTPMPIV